MPNLKNGNEPQVAPHLRVEIRGPNDVSQIAYVKNGDRILWVNVHHRECAISFGESPFSDKTTTHRVAVGTHVLSPPIKGPIHGQYKYAIECIKDDDDDPCKGDPVIVITG